MKRKQKNTLRSESVICMLSRSLCVSDMEVLNLHSNIPEVPSVKVLFVQNDPFKDNVHHIIIIIIVIIYVFGI